MLERETALELLTDGLDTVPQVAKFLHLSVASVYKLMDKGQLPSLKIGRARRVPHRAVIEFAARHLMPRPAERG
jgi:excisionase family DNA binding protein